MLHQLILTRWSHHNLLHPNTILNLEVLMLTWWFLLLRKDVLMENTAIIVLIFLIVIFRFMEFVQVSQSFWWFEFRNFLWALLFKFKLVYQIVHHLIIWLLVVIFCLFWGLAQFIFSFEWLILKDTRIEPVFLLFFLTFFFLLIWVTFLLFWTFILMVALFFLKRCCHLVLIHVENRFLERLGFLLHNQLSSQ